MISTHGEVGEVWSLLIRVINGRNLLRIVSAGVYTQKNVRLGCTIRKIASCGRMLLFHTQLMGQFQEIRLVVSVQSFYCNFPSAAGKIILKTILYFRSSYLILKQSNCLVLKRKLYYVLVKLVEMISTCIS